MATKKRSNNLYFFCYTFIYDDCDIIEYTKNGRLQNDKFATKFAIFFHADILQDKFGDILTIEIFRDEIAYENLIEVIIY